MAKRRWWIQSSVFIGLLIAASCGQIDAPVIPRIDPALLTPEAAQGVNGNGLFVLRGERSGEISVDQARTLATAFWRDVGPYISGTIEHDRGGIVHTQLVPCARSYYVESAYTNVPVEVPINLQKELGAQWLVGMCVGTTEEVVIAVSAMATDASVSGGRITVGQANFFCMGVPVGAEIPAAPENIAAVSANSSAKRVSAVPGLTMRAFPASPTTAVWQVAIEAPAVAIGAVSRSSRPLQTFVAGALNGWGSIAFAAPNPNAPNDQSEVIPFQLITGATISFTVTRRVDVPKSLELISFGGR
jgi:hypothetical protein